MKHLWLLWMLLVLSGSAFAQDDDDEDEDAEAPSGLIATYTVGDQSVNRIDSYATHVWDGASDARLPAGAFRATWKANLLLQRSGDYRFHAFVDGAMKLTVNGETLIDGEASGGWLDSKVMKLSFGDQPIDIRFESDSNGSGTLKLFWSSNAFPIEPIPGRLFSIAEPEPDAVATSAAQSWHTAYRCARCHREDRFEEPDPAPSLERIRGALSRDWVIEKLTKQPDSDAKMPHFGFSKTEAEEVAAFLFSASQKAGLAKTSDSKDREADFKAGRKLVRSIGCLACHQLDEIGSSGPYFGGDLSSVKQKRSAAWIDKWLSDPKSLNSDHRMPVFELSKLERKQIASFLSGDSIDSPTDLNGLQVARGKSRVKAAGCANCHSIRGIEPGPVSGKRQSSCLDPQAEHTGARYPQIDNAMKAAITKWHRSVRTKPSSYHRGQLLLERRNCIACHQRDGALGLLPIVGQLVQDDRSLRAVSQGLIPPALTAVGDKLKDEALAKAISGRQKKRLPWLSVRMPKFHHTKVESAALVNHLIEHDRIPPHPGFGSPETKSDTSTLVAGQSLIGPSGFSCIACHSAGKYEPRNVALGTRGSDLLNLGQRMRKEFFARWVRSPTRIIPGMEMPSITRPVKGVLDGQIHTQLAAAWNALNDEKFTVPTNPASFEQFVRVEPGAPARVIRDVFTDPSGKGYVARPLVIGLNNGHNLMFDLDRFGLRHWWFGDTARQRTEGKSWYWDAAGINIASQKIESDVLLRSSSGEILKPVVNEATSGQLIGSQNGSRGYQFVYALNFVINEKPTKLVVIERIEPYHFGEGLTGFRRVTEIPDIPTGHTPLLRFVERPDVEVINEQDVTKIDEQSYIVCANGTSDLGFLVDLKRPPAKPTTLPPLVSEVESITSVPGFEGERLPLPRSIMPTSIAFRPDGNMVFSSLKGHVFVARDSDSDGIPDTLTTFEEGLAAPFGVLPNGDDLLVAHKPEILRLRDVNGDDRADQTRVESTGWGYSDNYHDWTCGLVRDSKGDIYFGLGSDYSQRKRPKNRAKWRGAVMRLTKDGKTEPVSWSFRYPVGFAIDGQDRVFVTDNQGVQNTFNEVNHVQMGKHYGVPSRYEPNPDKLETTPAIRVPHPWVRSMNAIVFLPDDHASPFGGHMIGCEYDTHMLIRMTFQTVGDVVQGAAYYFSKPGLEGGGNNFVGPICAAVSKSGEIYVGSIHDSGWLGGQNTGAIERIRFKDDLPNGIRELRATHDGFEIELVRAISPDKLRSRDAYSISTYTRKWQGSYATPDSGRHEVAVEEIEVADDGRLVRLTLSEQHRTEHVYEVTVKAVDDLFPATGHYTMKRVPEAD